MVVKKSYGAFWKAMLSELKHKRGHNAWTLSFDLDGQRLVEHEFNTPFTPKEFHARLLRIFGTHWPGKLPERLAVHHVEVHSYDPSTGSFVQRTNSNLGKGLPGRANVIIGGVPKEALTALKKLGGVRPPEYEILRHV